MFTCVPLNLYSFSGRNCCIIVAGGWPVQSDIQRKLSDVEVLAKDIGIKQLPNLPAGNIGSSMVLHNGTILLCGGYDEEQKCLQMEHGTWKDHSTLNKGRRFHSAVTTETATFLFGGCMTGKTYEYLPKDSTRWLMGKTEIPGREYSRGCAVFVKSKQEIWLIGGYIPGAVGLKRILIFNVNDHTFRVSESVLNVARLSLTLTR